MPLAAARRERGMGSPLANKMASKIAQAGASMRKASYLNVFKP